jgi:hypothetical protein
MLTWMAPGKSAGARVDWSPRSSLGLAVSTSERCQILVPHPFGHARCRPRSLIIDWRMVAVLLAEREARSRWILKRSTVETRMLRLRRTPNSTSAQVETR